MASSLGFSSRIRVAIAAHPDKYQNLIDQIRTYFNINPRVEFVGSIGSGGDECLESLYDLRVDVLLLAEGWEGVSSELELARQINRKRPRTAILILASDTRYQDPSYLHEAMRAGVADVMNITTPQLATWANSINRAFELVQDRLKAEETNGQLIVFHSLKGGVGKTLLATNLSAALAVTEHRVLFIDMCWPFGGAETFFNLQHSSTSILDLIPVIHTLHPDNIANAAIAQRENLWVLTAPPPAERSGYLEDVVFSGRLLEDSNLNITESFIKDAEIANIELGMSDTDKPKIEYLKAMLRNTRAHQSLYLLVRRLLNNAQRAYDFIIVDAPAIVDDRVLYTLRQADKLLIICTPDVPAIQATQTELKFLSELEIDRHKISLILNKTSKSNEIRPFEIKNLFQEETFTYQWLDDVPADPGIESLVNTSTLAVEALKDMPFSEAIRRMARQFSAKSTVSNQPTNQST